MTLPANSTFLPILDDLLSPDFRPVLLPAQTPQTPTDVILFGGTKFVTNACGNIMGKNVPGSLRDRVDEEGKKRRPLSSKNLNSLRLSQRGGGDGAFNNTESAEKNINDAVSKIQRWWRSKRGKNVDMAAERAKHSIRHSRTEDHIRYLESEVSRLKSALSSERKIRSLQLEAIRSLWSQVQRILTSEQAANNVAASLMTRSVPNGFSNESFQVNNNGVPAMSLSMNAALENKMQDSMPGQSSGMCSCSTEVQSLRESFSHEMDQLRSMITDLTKVKENSVKASAARDEKMEKAPASITIGSSGNILVSDDQSLSNSTVLTASNTNQKRPATLNLVSSSNDNPNDANSPETQEVALASEEQKEQIADYASQMASKLVDDAVEEKDMC